MPSFTRLLPAVLLLALAACDRGAPPPTAPAAPTPTSDGARPDATRTGATQQAAIGSQAAPRQLTGSFEIAATRWGEAWTALSFDEVALSMENERVIRVSGRGTPAIDSAIDAIESIQVETASPEGKRLIESCSGGCTIEGTIVERERGEWVLTALQRATPAPAARPLDVDGRDPRRKALLDALRPVIEQDLGQSVQFVVETLRERDGSAFAAVHPRTPQGRPIDFAKTPHAQRLADGALDGDTVFALLQYRDGRWQVREYAVAPTDVAWAGWAEAYGAPDAIFVGAER